MVVKNVIQHRDPRIGVCLDIGWITAAGFDAEKVYQVTMVGCLIFT